MNANQRQFYRRAFLDDAPPAVLIHERHHVSCCLIETSLGGFAVLVSKELKNATNELARLQMEGLEYIVRIARQKSLGDCVLIGMQRIEEVVPNPSPFPDSPLSRQLTVAAWSVAVGTLGVACYLLWKWGFEADFLALIR